MTFLAERIDQKMHGDNSASSGYSPRKVEVDIEWITPNKAQAYLDTMGLNRNVSSAVVDKYGRDITAERWMINTQGIGFDIHDRLIDGQHRLMAIVKTGIPVYLAVFRNLHPDAMRTVDDNRKRTFSDDLKIEGREQYVKVASATAMIVRFQRGKAKGLAVSTAAKIPLSRVEERQELRRLDAEGDLATAVKTAGRLRQEIGVAESAGSAVYYLATAHYGEEFTDAFFHALISGADLHDGDPTLALRRYLIKYKDARPKVPAHIQAAALLKGLRMEATGDTIVQFKTHDLARSLVSRLFTDQP